MMFLVQFDFADGKMVRKKNDVTDVKEFQGALDSVPSKRLTQRTIVTKRISSGQIRSFQAGLLPGHLDTTRR